jgi:hypothetical protein
MFDSQINGFTISDAGSGMVYSGASNNIKDMIQNCYFTRIENRSLQVVIQTSDSCSISNCMFFKNKTAPIYKQDNGFLIINNCTFLENEHTSSLYAPHAAIFNDVISSIIIKNCIFNDKVIDTEAQEIVNDGWLTDISYSCFSKFPDTVLGLGLDYDINTNQIGIPVLSDDGLRLISGECCINKGSNGPDVPLTDIFGKPRFGPVDIGAFEVQP